MNPFQSFMTVKSQDNKYTLENETRSVEIEEKSQNGSDLT